MGNYPDALRYTKEHEWTRIAGNTATVGITIFAKDQLGDVVYLELPEVGATITRGQTFGVVESTKAVSELFAPVSGKDTKVNKALVDAPEGVKGEQGTVGRARGFQRRPAREGLDDRDRTEPPRRDRAAALGEAVRGAA